MSLYKKGYRECPGRFETLFRYTRTCNDAGEDDSNAVYFERAMRYADTLIAAYPDSMQGYFLKAAAAGNLTDYVSARRKVRLAPVIKNAAQKALSIRPEYAPAHVILGSYYREVAIANPVLKTLAKAFFGEVPQGTLQDALQHLHTAVELEPDNMFAHLSLARTYLHMKRESTARYHLDKVLSLPVSNHQHPQMKRQARMLLQRR
jgi:tetratricopeptide (TPR) repeat protein